MNVLAMPTDQAVRALVSGNRAGGWWNDKGLMKLAKRTAFRDCNEDEFDQAVAFCRERNLSPLTGQLFAFVFSKDDPKKRNMVIVTSIMGYRAIANRAGNYMPGPAKAFFDDAAKDPLTNPRGVVRAEATVEKFVHGAWKSLTEEAYWESFAPLVKGNNPGDYITEDTGETWPDSGKAKLRRVLKPGVAPQLILDPKKDGWIRMSDVMLKKCPEAQACRRGWPEDLSGIYVEEEIHRSQVIDADYVDLTPSEMVARAEADDRLMRIGGPALHPVIDGAPVAVPIGKFADRVLAATANMPPTEVAAFMRLNQPILNEFWAREKRDALELKKILETRSGVVATPAGDEGTRAKAAPPQHGEPDTGGAAGPTKAVPGALTGAAAEKLKNQLLADIRKLQSMNDFLVWTRDAQVHIARLPELMQQAIATEFQRCQGHIGGAN